MKKRRNTKMNKQFIYFLRKKEQNEEKNKRAKI